MRSSNAIASVVLVGLLTLDCAPVAAAVRASVDEDHVAPGSSLRLTLERDGQGQDAPDLAPLKQDFDILSTSRSSSVQIVNGSVSSHQQLLLTLSPRRDGTLQIPPLSWGKERSGALTVKVDASTTGGPATGAGSQATPGVFIDTEISPAHPWVQAAVTMTVRVLADTPLYQANLTLPSSGDVIALQAGGDQSSSETRNGHSYRVLVRHYVLFPQHSGSLQLPAPVLDAQVPAARPDDPFDNSLFGNFFGNAGLPALLAGTRPVRVRAKQVVLDVLPRPGAAGNATWLPATRLQLSASLDPASGHAQAGEPLTLNLHLQAQGLTAAQLPDLAAALHWPAGLKAYPDPPRLDNDTQGGTVTGTRDQSIALVADQAGRYEIPALHVGWWDTASGTARDAVLPAQVLALSAPATGAAATATRVAAPSTAAAATAPDARAAPATATTASARAWRRVSAALLAAWLATLLAAWWFRRGTRRQRRMPSGPRPPRANAASARAAFHEACRSNDAPAARTKLLAWLAAGDPAVAGAGLRGLASRSGDAALPDLLRQLDRACYGDGTWEGSALARALSKLPRAPNSASARDPLPPLYRRASR